MKRNHMGIKPQYNFLDTQSHFFYTPLVKKGILII